MQYHRHGSNFVFSFEKLQALSLFFHLRPRPNHLRRISQSTDLIRHLITIESKKFRVQFGFRGIATCPISLCETDDYRRNRNRCNSIFVTIRVRRKRVFVKSLCDFETRNGHNLAVIRTRRHPVRF